MIRSCSSLFPVLALLLAAPASAAPDDGTVGPPPTCGTLIFGGSVSGTWTPAGSPYCILADTQINGLTIQPGVEVHVDGPYTLTVAGILTAVGTAADPIRFSSRDPDSMQRWGGLFFNFSTPGSVMEHCLVEFANDSGVRIVDSSPTLRDCVIRRCSTTTNGGGMFISMTSGSLTLERVFLLDNTSTVHGGGLRADLASGTLTLTECCVSRNTSNPTATIGNRIGGGLYVTGNLTVCESVISDNYARGQGNGGTRTARGGGIYIENGDIEVRATFVGGNRVEVQGGGTTRQAWGGGLLVDGGTATIANSIFGANECVASSFRDGAAIYLQGGAVGDISNCTLARNSNLITSAALYVDGSATATLTNSILYWNNVTSVVPPTYGDQIGGAGTVTSTYNDIQGIPLPDPDNNINVNPVFVDTGAEPCDLIIDPGSSLCKDAGDPGPAFNDACMPPGVGGVRNDMGAHGGPGNCAVTSLNGVGSHGVSSRNGSGSNPNVLSQVCPAVIGQPWTTFVDEASQGADASAVSISVNGPLNGFPTGIGELLCVPPFQNGFTTIAVGGVHGFTLPPQPLLVGKRFCAQATLIYVDPLSLQFTNALDVRIGSY